MNTDFYISNDTLSKYTGTDRIVTIPDGVINISANAFKHSSGIQEVIIPKSVKSICDFEYPFDYKKIAYEIIYSNFNDSKKLKSKIVDNHFFFDIPTLSNKMIDIFTSNIYTTERLRNVTNFHSCFVDKIPFENIKILFKYLRLNGDKDCIKDLTISTMILKIMEDDVSSMRYISLYTQNEFEKIFEIALMFKSHKCVAELLEYKNTHYGFSSVEKFDLND